MHASCVWKRCTTLRGDGVSFNLLVYSMLKARQCSGHRVIVWPMNISVPSKSHSSSHTVHV